MKARRLVEHSGWNEELGENRPGAKHVAGRAPCTCEATGTVQEFCSSFMVWWRVVQMASEAPAHPIFLFQSSAVQQTFCMESSVSLLSSEVAISHIKLLSA